MAYPYSVTSGSNLRMLRPRQRPGPYLYTDTGRIFGVFRDSSTRQIEFRYTEDEGVNWTEADSGDKPTQTASTDGQEGGLQHASCSRRTGNTVRAIYAANGGTSLTAIDFDLTTAQYGLPITGGPNSAHGWDFCFLDNGDTEIFYNTIVSSTYYEIWRVVLSGSSWGTPQQITDATTEDEIQCPPFSNLCSSVVASVAKYSSGDRMLFYHVNNNNHSFSSSPFVRARLISGTTTATVGDPSRGRPPLMYATGVDTEGYFNGAAEIISCGDVEIAVMPFALASQISNLTNYNGGSQYFDAGIACVYESDPIGMRVEFAAPILLSQRDIGPSWHQVPCLLWDESTHSLRYYVQRCYENEHPTREGDTDLICAGSKLGAWEAESVIFAANGVESSPSSGYWLNTFGLLSAAFVQNGDVGILMQASQSASTSDTYEKPHYFQYTPAALTATSPCGSGAATVGNINAAR